MSLRINLEDMEGYTRGTEESDSIQEGQMRVRKVYGKDLNIGIWERGKYHTAPHVHESEQMNHILEGKVWWFVDDEAFLLKPGDFHRVPSNAVHWAKSEEHPIRMVEAHSPPLEISPGDDGGLFADDETAEPNATSVNLVAEVENWEEKEAQMIEAYYEEHPDER